eukprot:TRINITY_DN6938_c0_g1_i3.p1 TRINITY_DN6938_c0_g1~~TRINITY_DN6938_c0_g1_i3.p1  ORF type:complete len:154 (+),score=61.56 TRINITY_DN6938_c0_g1_i3:324-785(+)
MVTNPEKWVKDFAKAGASSLTFHIEAVENPAQLIKEIHDNGMHAAIAIKPNTSVEKIIPFLDSIEMVLVMTVEPGFGGQSFMEGMMPKVKQIRSLKPELNIQVDGGIDANTISKAAEAGATTFVAGSAIFKHPGKYESIIAQLRSTAEEKRSK